MATPTSIPRRSMRKSRRRPSGTAITSCARDITSANKAPGGFGLGNISGRTANSFSEITGYGFYRIPSESGFAPDASSNWGAVYIGANLSYGTLLYARNNALMAVRSVSEGKVGPIEWVNPPMAVGVEYRTTERFQGKPVYVKVVDCGVMTNNKTIAITDDSKRILDVILKGNPTLFPMMPNGSGLGEWEGCFTAGGMDITLYAGDKLAASNHYAVAIAKLIDA